MKAFSLYETKSNTILSTHDSVRSGMSQALTVMLAMGRTECEVTMSIAGCQFRHEGVLLLEVKPSTPRPTGRPRMERELVEKPFRFNGRPSARGWVASKTMVELDMEKVANMVPEKQRKDDCYQLVYMDRYGQPLAMRLISYVISEATARRNRTGGSVTWDDVALDISYNYAVPEAEVPDGCVAVFVVAPKLRTSPFALRPVGKRLIDTFGYRPMTIATSAQDAAPAGAVEKLRKYREELLRKGEEEAAQATSSRSRKK